MVPTSAPGGIPTPAQPESSVDPEYLDLIFHDVRIIRGKFVAFDEDGTLCEIEAEGCSVDEATKEELFGDRDVASIQRKCTHDNTKYDVTPIEVTGASGKKLKVCPNCVHFPIRKKKSNIYVVDISRDVSESSWRRSHCQRTATKGHHLLMMRWLMGSEVTTARVPRAIEGCEDCGISTFARADARTKHMRTPKHFKNATARAKRLAAVPESVETTEVSGGETAEGSGGETAEVSGGETAEVSGGETAEYGAVSTAIEPEDNEKELDVASTDTPQFAIQPEDGENEFEAAIFDIPQSVVSYSPSQESPWMYDAQDLDESERGATFDDFGSEASGYRLPSESISDDSGYHSGIPGGSLKRTRSDQEDAEFEDARLQNLAAEENPSKRYKRDIDPFNFSAELPDMLGDNFNLSNLDEDNNLIWPNTLESESGLEFLFSTEL
ncbi:hypothetical protein EUX98_g6407 [Antrodiella citrinella]|uniref:Uncharacterized protein n=1 Tax=Antrodiella citrinella TaxID=2447956 RepID=A0A4S4MP26_9APHY|nr:hypothetical protein EUX98_g6407 [Antrodiella citrinella]